MSYEVYRDCNKTVAHLPGVHLALRQRAEEAKARAQSTLARHKGHENRNSSPNHSFIDITTGDVDVFLNLNDPDGGAKYIEFGARGWRGTFAITGAW